MSSPDVSGGVSPKVFGTVQDGGQTPGVLSPKTPALGGGVNLLDSVSDLTRATPGRPRMKAILIFGPPGSGKGTQGTILGAIPFLIHISTGDMMRKLSRQGKLAAELLHFSSRGLLVPDELTVRIWRRHMHILELQEFYDRRRQVLILDGIPRTRSQAELLADTIEVVMIIHLVLHDENRAIERLRLRALRENRLDDANDEVIRRRFEIYHGETEPTLAYYDRSLVTDVDADRSPIEVLYDLVGHLRTVPGLMGM